MIEGKNPSDPNGTDSASALTERYRARVDYLLRNDDVKEGVR